MQFRNTFIFITILVILMWSLTPSMAYANSPSVMTSVVKKLEQGDLKNVDAKTVMELRRNIEDLFFITRTLNIFKITFFISFVVSLVKKFIKIGFIALVLFFVFNFISSNPRIMASLVKLVK